MGRALIPCVCGGSSGWCCVSLRGYVQVQGDRRREGGGAWKTIWLGTGPAQQPWALFSPPPR